MISLIVILTLSLVAITAAGFLLFNQNMLFMQQMKAQENQLFLKNIETLLIQSSRPATNNNEYILPFGDDTATNYHTVPQWLAPQRKNPWGHYVLYCPFGATSQGETNNTVSELSNDYSVQTIENFKTKVQGSQEKYVASSQYKDNNNDGTLEKSPDFNTGHEIRGFLMSHFSSGEPQSDCRDITYIEQEKKFTAQKATVKAIYKKDMKSFNTLKRVTDKAERDEYWFDINNEGDNTLKENLSFYNSFYDKDKAYFYLHGGVHEIDDFSFINEELNKKEIVFIGEVNNENIDTQVSSSGSLSNLEFEGYNVTFENIYFDETINLSVKNGDFLTKNLVEINKPFIKNSQWRIEGQTKALSSIINNENDILNGENSSVFLKNSYLLINDASSLSVMTSTEDDWGIYGTNSEILIEGDNSSDNLIIDHGSNSNQYGIVLYQSNWDMTNSNIEFKSSNTQTMAIYLDRHSQYNAFNGQITFSGYETSAFFLRGRMESNNQNISFNNFVSTVNSNAIIMKDGAELVLRGSTSIGNSTSSQRPYIGIKDEGGKFIGGEGSGSNNVEIYANERCWQGPSTSNPRIFTATNSVGETINSIGKNGSTTQVKDTEDDNYNTLKIMNNSIWNCNV